MTRIVLAALALAYALATPALFLITPAMALAGVEVIAAPATPVVVFPWGEYVVAAGQLLTAILLPVLVTVITSAIHQVSPWLRFLISDQLVESSLRKWLDYAVNEVAAATKDGVLSVPVGSAVLAKAVQRGIDRADASTIGAMVMKAAGGPQEAAAKLFRMLKLEEGASAAAVLAPVQSMLPAK